MRSTGWTTWTCDPSRTGREGLSAAHVGPVAAVGLVGKEADLFRFTVKHSLLFAAIIGIVALGEPFHRQRAIAVLVILAGIILLRVG